jgi:SAM-dependent methyltransferase
MPWVLSRCLLNERTLPAHRVLLDLLLSAFRSKSPRYLSIKHAVALHSAYPRRDGYKYDRVSRFSRAAARLTELQEVISLSKSGRYIELGLGDGSLALSLVRAGYSCDGLDLQDWRDDECRNSRVSFYHVPESGAYPCRNCEYDGAFSYNTFEHIRDPAAALAELARIVKPGGRIFLSFGPLFNSAFGLHAYRTVHHPYPQFLLSHSTLQQFVYENGINDLGGSRHDFQFVNRWTVRQYRDLFQSVSTKLRPEIIEYSQDAAHLNIVYRHFGAFVGRKLNYEELTTDHIRACFVVL